ncbi:MAG: ATP-binding protein [Chitinophagia bacterium]|nr:ATP-binding protein [Chitinophagia bacterium]
MDALIGREEPIAVLERALQTPVAELIAVYGRRRIGKTFLVRKVFARHLLFECSGVHEARLSVQLKNFSFALSKALKTGLPLQVPPTWMDAFQMLEQLLTPQLGSKQPTVLFFDEFPWLQTPKSGFLAAFEHFWNSWASRQPQLKVVICGSAASWMIQNVLKNKGGLHNRVTVRLRLEPFNLYETEAYLRNRSVKLDRYQILQLYMAMGGVPHYLATVRPGESAAQAIDRECFSPQGLLHSEFTNLFVSLFHDATQHLQVANALAEKTTGITRTEIIARCGMKSGGTATEILNELEESGFIKAYVPFAKQRKDALYRLNDEYSLFYNRFIAKSRATGTGTWLRLAERPAWRAWSGYAFEAICLKHVGQLKKALGIAGVFTTETAWRHQPAPGEQGAQIDLLLDRTDHCINLCEMKYSTNLFTLTKAYAADLQRKQMVFQAQSQTRKTLFITLVTTFGVANKADYAGLLQNEITMDALFER